LHLMLRIKRDKSYQRKKINLNISNPKEVLMQLLRKQRLAYCPLIAN
jgi:hypothetical protein